MKKSFNCNEIVIVSGLPRSGTSMLMHMLDAGGMTILTDSVRNADLDNPKGYFELEAVKRLYENTSWMSSAAGKAIKVISILLPCLPLAYRYKVLFINRSMDEVLASQRAMLARRQTEIKSKDAAMDLEHRQREEELLRAAYIRHLHRTRNWLNAQSNIATCYIEHRNVLQHPQDAAAQINLFLGGNLNETDMVAAVDGTLYRQRME